MTYLYVMPIIPIIIISILGRYRRQYFGLLELHFLALIFGFLIYTLIDVSFNPPTNVNELVVISLFVLVTASIMMTALFLHLCGSFVTKKTSLSYMALRWASASQRFVVGILVVVALFNAILFFKYGIISHFSEEELKMLGFDIPTWVGPVKASFVNLTFAAFLFASSSLILNKGKKGRMLNIVILSVTIALFALNGRRSLINLAIVAVPLLSLARGISLYSLRNFLYFAVVGVILIIFSNVYQTYRGELLSVSGPREFTNMPSFSEASMNFAVSAENLRARMAMWKFNYLIAEKQFAMDTPPLFGEVYLGSFLNSLPSIFFPEKKYIDPDDIVATGYSFAHTDYPTSDLSSMQADFGVGTIVLYPILVLAPIIFLALIRTRPDFYLICSSLIIAKLINIESSPGDFFMLFRDILMFWCVFYLWRILSAAVSFVFRMQGQY